jgi:hypothetical protein
MSLMPDKIDRLDGAFYMRAEWRLCRVVWPQRCNITGRRLLPGTLAYRGEAVWTGPGEPVTEHKWHERHEHVLWQLKETQWDY